MGTMKMKMKMNPQDNNNNFMNDVDVDYDVYDDDNDESERVALNGSSNRSNRSNRSDEKKKSGMKERVLLGVSRLSLYIILCIFLGLLCGNGYYDVFYYSDNYSLNDQQDNNHHYSTDHVQKFDNTVSSSSTTNSHQNHQHPKNDDPNKDKNKDKDKQKDKHPQNDNSNNDDNSNHNNNNNDDNNWPRLAWLLSFPNSGTSYTTRIIRHISLTNTASNYGEEFTDHHTGESIPLDTDHPEGPFLIGDPKKYKRPTGQIYVLTKTHCGGRCERCGPTGYVENLHSFHKRCFAGKRKQRPHHGKQKDGKHKHTTVTVDTVTSSPIYRAVHLIRDPFDNIVSRFHLEKKLNYSAIADIPADLKRGFWSFCAKMIDRKYHDQEQANRIWDDQVLKLLEDVPCRSDFYRWVLWHDMAFAMTTDMQIPVHIIHYEDYETNFNKTVGDLVQFLQVETVGEPDTFKKGLRYKDYFTKEQQKKVGLAAKQLALPATWNNIKHYFDIK